MISLDVSETSAIERVARVLAGASFSKNASGDQASAAGQIDQTWPDFTDAAKDVLRTLREPDRAMAAAGDPRIWRDMIRASLGEAPTPWANADADIYQKPLG